MTKMHSVIKWIKGLPMKKVGIIGSGNVGKALAIGFMNLGYETTIASRKEETRKNIEKEFNGKVKTTNPENTVKNNDIIVFAVKGSKAKEALKLLGPENLAGKIIIDTTNPIADYLTVKAVLAPGAKFVKVFSSVGSSHMVNPSFESKTTMFICGNDSAAKEEVTKILDKFGWETEDMGAVEAARAIEPLAILWCIPGFLKNSWSHAFKLLKT